MPILVVAGGHHTTSHHHVAVPLTRGSVLKIVVLNYVYRVVVYLLLSPVLPFPLVVVGTVLWRSNAFSGAAEGTAFSIGVLVSRCVWMHVDLLVEVCI